MKLVPDASVLIEGTLSRKHVSDEIIVHEAIVSFFEKEARENKSTGLIGISELEKLKKGNLRFSGKPNRFEELDHMVRQLAFDEGATLITSDEIQAKIATAMGISVILEIPKISKLKLEQFFDKTTMSVHLRENIQPSAKRGSPGAWKFEAISNKKMQRDDIENISREIIEEARIRKDGFIEIERSGSTIVQLADYRIVITRPPFSDGWEITAVRPVKKLSLDEYNLSDKLMERILEKAEGVLIAGSPGMGKSTFAAALAEHYASMQKIVKTVEAPRDLVLPESITQYAISHADSQEVHDILLLSRPDYTFFDEMRNTDDFRLFADLRLAGIGFIGVVHATNPIDAIQRFVGRIELGVIPQVIDTVVFIKDGTVHKILSLQMLVKVPSGMTEADLARPVFVVSDFETRKAEFELYSYGEETVVIPVSEERKSPALALAQRQLESEFTKWSKNVEVEMLSTDKCIVYIPEDKVPKLIGRQGKNINDIEAKLGLSIDVRPLEKTGPKLPFDTKIMSKSIVFQLRSKYANKEVQISVDGDYLLSAKISKKGIIKVKKNNKIGKIIEDSINMGEDLVISK